MKIKDTNNVPKLIKVLNELSKLTLQVGIFAEDDSFIAMIANVHEYGVNITVTPKMRGFFAAKGVHLKRSTTSITIPERSFIREGFDECKSRLEDLAISLIDKVIHFEMSPSDFYKMLGEYAVGEIKDYLTNKRTPPNSPMTIREKRSSNPLIDTGRLRNSITYKVV